MMMAFSYVNNAILIVSHVVGQHQMIACRVILILNEKFLEQVAFAKLVK
jgi:hypothetical protein